MSVTLTPVIGQVVTDRQRPIVEPHCTLKSSSLVRGRTRGAAGGVGGDCWGGALSGRKFLLLEVFSAMATATEGSPAEPVTR